MVGEKQKESKVNKEKKQWIKPDIKERGSMGDKLSLDKLDVGL
jgi:hypothetical protein